jgi:hypothetical protein
MSNLSDQEVNNIVMKMEIHEHEKNQYGIYTNTCNLVVNKIGLKQTQ